MTEPAGPVVVERADDVVVVRVRGEIDLANASSLERAVLPELTAAAGVIVDLEAVSYLDSSALQVLDRVAAAAARRSVPLRVVAPDGSRAQRVLRLCAFPDDLIAEHVEDARAALHAG